MPLSHQEMMSVPLLSGQPTDPHKVSPNVKPGSDYATRKVPLAIAQDTEIHLLPVFQIIETSLFVMSFLHEGLETVEKQIIRVALA